MERELLETFEVAKKAADAASAGGSHDADRCMDALQRLKKISVTTEVLVATQVGKRLRSFTKHPHKGIQSMSSDLLQAWKDVVIRETSNGKKQSSSSHDDKSDNSESRSSHGNTKLSQVSARTSLKVENSDSDSVASEFGSRAKNVNMNSFDSDVMIAAKPDRVPKEEHRNQQIFTPPKLTSMVKTNDSARDKIRELLADAFSKVFKETKESTRQEVLNILDEVVACDPIRMAVMVESAIFQKIGSSTGAQKQKYRSIMFNLRADNNPDFRRKVLLGQVKPERIVDLTPEEMASDARKQENKQIKEKALFDSERAGAPKATTDQFKCGRCGQRKTTYYQLQTRSADEPMTTFVTCVNCNNHWKFC